MESPWPGWSHGAQAGPAAQAGQWADAGQSAHVVRSAGRLVVSFSAVGTPTSAEAWVAGVLDVANAL